MKLNLKLDAWQEEVLETKGNLVLCSGRQVGKSTVIAIKAGESAIKNDNWTIMIIASVERQALLLFEKVLSHIFINYKNQILEGKDKPTKHVLKLKNGSVIHCLPTGETGYGIRGYTINELYADEAHFIKDAVWAAVTPMLATTGGTINLLSTPFGTTGYFYRCYHDDKFKRIHVNTEDVAKKRLEPQRTQLLEFLKDEKLRMTKLQYQQEYLGLFVGGIQRLFSDELIDEICTLNERFVHGSVYNNFLGVDIAHLGGDETVLVSVEKIRGQFLRMFDLDINDHTRLTETVRLILHKDKQYNYKTIYLDDGGMGVGVFDPLYENEQTKRKVVGINNASRSIERKTGKMFKDRRKRLLKEDLYNNLKHLMENKKIELFNNPELRQSLRSIQYEITDEGNLRIYGTYAHIAEAIIRAAWSVKDKSLNIYFYS